MKSLGRLREEFGFSMNPELAKNSVASRAEFAQGVDGALCRSLEVTSAHFHSAIAKVVILTILTSCTVTPILYSAALAVWPNFPFPYSRVFNRVVLAMLVVFVLSFRAKLGLRSFGTLLGLAAWRRDIPALCFGMALSLGTSLAILPLIVASTLLEWSTHPTSYFLTRIPGAILTGLCISLLEEIFFRAMFFRSLRSKYSFIVAAFISSAVYGVVHFITPLRSYVYPGYSPLVGFEYFVLLFQRLAQPGLIGGVVGLFLVGLVLCLALEKTRSLIFCVGLHSGWVMAMKLAMYSTLAAAAGNFLPATGQRYFIVTQPITWCSIGVVGVVVVLYARFRERRGGLGDSSRSP